jgi:hypothetical protein
VELRPDDTSNLWAIPPEQVAKCPDERLRKGLLDLAGKIIEKTNGGAEAYFARAALLYAYGRGGEATADVEKARKARKALGLKAPDGGNSPEGGTTAGLAKKVDSHRPVADSVRWLG